MVGNWRWKWTLLFLYLNCIRIDYSSYSMYSVCKVLYGNNFLVRLHWTEYISVVVFSFAVFAYKIEVWLSCQPHGRSCASHHNLTFKIDKNWAESYVFSDPLSSKKNKIQISLRSYVHTPPVRLAPNWWCIHLKILTPFAI